MPIASHASRANFSRIFPTAIRNTVTGRVYAPRVQLEVALLRELPNAPLIIDFEDQFLRSASIPRERNIELDAEKLQ